MSGPTASGTRRRGRPPASDGSQVATRDRVLAAAAQRLGSHGYADTRLEDIAELAGVRAPAIYHYFESRDALIAAVMKEGQSRLRDHVVRMLAEVPADASAIDRICVAVEAHLRGELELSDYARAVMRNAGQVPPTIRDAIRSDGRAYYAIWRELIVQAEASGELRPDIDPRIARMLLMGALNWTAEWWTGSQPVDTLIETATTMIRAALANPS